MNVARAQCFIPRVAIHARKVLLTGGTGATTELLLHLLTVGRFQWAKHADIARLQFVRCMRGQSAEDNVLLKAVCHHFQRLMRTETVADQHSRSTVRLCSCQRIEHQLDPFKVDPRVHIPVLTACKAPAWRCMGCPAADMRDARPDDQWGKGLAVCADTLYGSDHRPFYTSTSIVPEIISAD
jgi:hypothetical protein